MVVIGLWLAIIGYGVLYSGVQKLGGKSCSLPQAFRGACTQAAPAPAATGQTAGQSRQSLLAQQHAAVPSAPVLTA